MRRVVAILGALALAVTACGSGGSPLTAAEPVAEAPAATSTASTVTAAATSAGTQAASTPAGETGAAAAVPATRTVEVYFVKDGLYAEAVKRTIPGTANVAANAIRALLRGPTAAEKARGLASAVPAATRLRGITVRDGIATIDLSRAYESGGGSFGMFARLAQVVYTLTQFPTIDGVNLKLDGEPVKVFSSEGIILDQPLTRAGQLNGLPLGPPTPTWKQSDLPSLTGVPLARRGKVVLVGSGDALNVRSGPGTRNRVLGKLRPGVVVRRIGVTKTVGISRWQKIAVPPGTGWVNSRYLAAVARSRDFVRSKKVVALLGALSRRFAADGDITSLASWRGLYVAHHADPILFRRPALATIMTSPTTYQWGSNALGPGSPEIPWRTFAEAVGHSFANTFDDPDVKLTWDVPAEGPNGRPARYAIPFPFKGFHYVSVFDKGDNPDYGGLDWTAWHVSIDYENGRPVVVGMTIDEWAP